jgi:TetR/AcrR family transcriptional regulator, transcriptional repressor for nem operon
MPSRQSPRRGPKPNPDTRKNLVQVGLRMLHAEGYAATGIQSIVEGADVPKGSFYNHFASKEAFGAEVLGAYFDRNEGKLRLILCNAQVAPRDRLEAYFEDRIEALKTAGFVKGCLLGNFSAEIADHSVLLRERLASQFKSWDHYFERCIAEAQEQGTIGTQLPATLLARFVLNSWEGALLRMRVEKSAAALIEFKKVIFGTVLA